MSQKKTITSIAHQYVNNVLAITVEIRFVIPYHGLIVYFKLKRFARLEISTSVINRIITEEKTTSLRGGCRGFFSNFDFVKIFRKLLGYLAASCTVLY